MCVCVCVCVCTKSNEVQIGKCIRKQIDDVLSFIQEICIRFPLGPTDPSECLGCQGAVRTKTYSRVEMILQQEEIE